MGLFSSRTKITTGVVTAKLMEDKPQFIKDVVLSSTLTSTNIAANIQQNLLTGFSSRVEAFYQYGKTRFVNGLPEGTATNTRVDVGAVRNAIQTEHTDTVVLNYTFVDTLNPDYLAYDFFFKNYSYDFNTKTLNTSPYGKPMLFDFALVVGVQVEIHLYEIIDDARVYSIYSIPLVLDSTKTYYHALYALTTDTSNTKVWFYDPSTGVFPELDLELLEYNSPFYPIIPIRTNKVNTVDSGDADLIRTSNRALQKLGSELETLTDAIMSEDGGNDPTVVDDAFITFATDIQTKSEAGLDYFHRFFTSLIPVTKVTKAQFEASISAFNLKSELLSYIGINDGEFKTLIVYNYIEKEILEGTLSSKYESETIIRPNSTMWGPNGIADYSIVNMSEIRFKKRISPTHYEQITVHGLKHISDVYPGREVERTLLDSITEPTEDDPQDRGFYIPLSRGITRSMSPIKKTELFYESLVLVVYAIQKTRLKWYQSSAFRFIITVIAIILTVYTWDFSGSWLTLAASIAKSLAINLAVQLALKQLVKIVGGKLAAILAIVAIAVALYYGALSGPDGLPWAEELLNLATLTLSAVSITIKDDFLNLQSDVSDFLKSAKELDEELEELFSGLGQSIDYLTLTRNNLFFDINETPDAFFERTIHETNPGVLSLEAIENYVNYKLRLPENNDFGDDRVYS
jgi:hypothetical protein